MSSEQYPTLPENLRAAPGATTDHVSGVLSKLDEEVVRNVPPGGNWRNLPDDFPSERVKQIRASAARGEGSRSTYYGRLRWDQPSYTISTYITRPGNGCFIHPIEDRLITVREAARLQTFPDGWSFSGTIRQRSVQIGNAVPPLLAFSVARQFAAGSAVDLFSGTGGLSLGATLAGHEIVAAIDNEPAAVRSHNLNLPGEAAFDADLGDEGGLKTALAEARSRAGGAVDLLLGGPPCQGFSTAGKGLKEDPRNRLLWSFIEAVRILKPRSVIMENVVALAQSRGRNHLAAARKELESLGYRTDVSILHAEGYGVPQKRRRTVMIASQDALPEWTLPHREIQAPAFLAQQPAGVESAPTATVSEAIADLMIPVGSSLDQHVHLGNAKSGLQRWLRGEMPVRGKSDKD